MRRSTLLTLLLLALASCGSATTTLVKETCCVSAHSALIGALRSSSAPVTEAFPAAGPLEISPNKTPKSAPEPTQRVNLAVLTRYQATITPAELAGLLYVFADDYLAGRETGQPGQRFAARFLAGQYQAMGISPHGERPAGKPYDISAYLQPFTVGRSPLKSVAVVATRNGRTFLTSTITKDDTTDVVVLPPDGGTVDSSEARLLYLGDTTGPALDALALADTYAIVLPKEDDDATRKHLLDLRKRGVRAVLLATEPTAAALAEAEGMLAFRQGQLTLPPKAGQPVDDAGFPPIFLTSLAAVQRLVGNTAVNGKPQDAGTELSIRVEREKIEVETENVVAFVPGTDLASEFVVISAHLDHLGVDPDLPGDSIYNGADDDGSGTVALLEIAEAFQRAHDEGHGPRRSILFLHFTGEEKAMLGSTYYTDRAPLVPLADTVANLNIDMIGRRDPAYSARTNPYVYILGSELVSTDLNVVNTRVNEATGLKLELSKRFNSLTDKNRFFSRSDHKNFAKHGVPFIFYFTGVHPDYHKPSDEVEKIDFNQIATVAQLIFGTAWELANSNDKPVLDASPETVAGFN